MKALVYGFLASGVAIEKPDDKPSLIFHMSPVSCLSSLSLLPDLLFLKLQSRASRGPSHPLCQMQRVDQSHEDAAYRGSRVEGTQGQSLLSMHLSYTSKPDPTLSWLF